MRVYLHNIHSQCQKFSDIHSFFLQSAQWPKVTSLNSKISNKCDVHKVWYTRNHIKMYISIIAVTWMYFSLSPSMGFGFLITLLVYSISKYNLDRYLFNFCTCNPEIYVNRFNYDNNKMIYTWTCMCKEM